MLCCSRSALMRAARSAARVRLRWGIITPRSVLNVVGCGVGGGGSSPVSVSHSGK